MLLLNISTTLMLAAGCYAAGLVTPAVWRLYRRLKRKPSNK